MSCVILVTGGTISGIGKGLVASSLGSLLQDVTFLKIDPYLNLNAGTLGPSEHGEVFVLKDGTETDLDLGNYQRFCNVTLDRDSTLTTGRMYMDIIELEKQNKFLGQTIQIIPHVSDYIEDRINKLLEKAKYCIIELGGSATDPENIPFVLSLARYQRKHKLFHIHVSLLPEIGEYKTKPIQASVQHFSKAGLAPDLIVARTLDKVPVEQKFMNKLENLLLTPAINIHNVDNLYDIPHQLLKLELKKHYKLTLSRNITYFECEKTISIAGKYSKAVDSYHSLIESLKIAGLNSGIKVNIVFNELDVDGIVVAGGFGSRGIDEKIETLKYARENKIPCIGICLGMQCMILEYYRNVLEQEANSEEFSDNHLVVKKLRNQMIKGLLPVNLCYYTKLFHCHGNNTHEIFRHKYGVIHVRGFKVSARCNGVIVGIELDNHPFFVGVQYHPEFMGSLKNPHPLFLTFLRTL